MDCSYSFSMKMLIDTFVNAVFLYDDKMVLTYNFHENTETITFGELQVVLPNGFRGSDMDLASEPETCLIARSDVFFDKKYVFASKEALHVATMQRFFVSEFTRYSIFSISSTKSTMFSASSRWTSRPISPFTSARTLSAANA